MLSTILSQDKQLCWITAIEHLVTGIAHSIELLWLTCMLALHSSGDQRTTITTFEDNASNKTTWYNKMFVYFRKLQTITCLRKPGHHCAYVNGW